MPIALASGARSLLGVVETELRPIYLGAFGIAQQFLPEILPWTINIELRRPE
jgi:hypothetical protein